MFLLKASSVAFCPLTGSQLLAINLQMDVPVSKLFWSVAAFLLRLFLFVFQSNVSVKKSDPSSSFSSSWVSLLVSIGASFGSSVFSLLCPSLHP